MFFSDTGIVRASECQSAWLRQFEDSRGDTLFGILESKRGSRNRKTRVTQYVVWLLISCSRSLFSGIVTRCANTGFLRIRAIVTILRIHAYVRIARMKYTLYRLAKTDSRAHFSILLVYYAQGLSRLHRFDIQLRHAVITTCSEQTLQSRLVPVISQILSDNLPSKFTYGNLCNTLVSSKFHYNIN